MIILNRYSRKHVCYLSQILSNFLRSNSCTALKIIFFHYHSMLLGQLIESEGKSKLKLSLEMITYFLYHSLVQIFYQNFHWQIFPLFGTTFLMEKSNLQGINSNLTANWKNTILVYWMMYQHVIVFFVQLATCGDSRSLIYCEKTFLTKFLIPLSFFRLFSLFKTISATNLSTLRKIYLLLHTKLPFTMLISWVCRLCLFGEPAGYVYCIHSYLIPRSLSAVNPSIRLRGCTVLDSQSILLSRTDYRWKVENSIYAICSTCRFPITMYCLSYIVYHAS